MAKIEKLCAKSVYDPPAYSQAIRVTGVQTILFLAGQVSYDKAGGVLHPTTSRRRRRRRSARSWPT